MARDEHNKAAEHHENAAKSHRAAAEHHAKGDHAKGKEHSTNAQQHRRMLANTANKRIPRVSNKNEHEARFASGLYFPSRETALPLQGFAQFANELSNIAYQQPANLYNARLSPLRSSSITEGGNKAFLRGWFQRGDPVVGRDPDNRTQQSPSSKKCTITPQMTTTN